MNEPKAGFTMGQPEHGVKCPECNCADMRVYRTIRHQDRIVRVRVCRHCDRRVTTYEKVAGEK